MAERRSTKAPRSPEEAVQQAAQNETERAWRREGLDRAQLDAQRKTAWNTKQILNVAHAYAQFLADGTMPESDPEAAPVRSVPPA